MTLHYLAQILSHPFPCGLFLVTLIHITGHGLEWEDQVLSLSGHFEVAGVA